MQNSKTGNRWQSSQSFSVAFSFQHSSEEEGAVRFFGAVRWV